MKKSNICLIRIQIKEQGGQEREVIFEEMVFKMFLK